MPEYTPPGHKLVENPKVSVCITTYNHEKYIAQALDSVLMQETVFPVEIIVGEDDSSDDTREICKRYKEQFPDRIRLFLNDRENVIYINGSATGRFNILNSISASKGSYIAILDGDDYWTDPAKLKQQVCSLETDPAAVLSFHDAKMVSDQDQLLEESRLRSVREDIPQYMLRTGVFVPSGSVLFRRGAIKYFDRLRRVPNFDTFLFAVLGHQGYAKFDYLIKPMVYRVHEGGIWSKRPTSQKSLWQVQTYLEISKIQKSRESKLMALKNCLPDFRRLCYYSRFDRNASTLLYISHFAWVSLQALKFREFGELLKDFLRKFVTGSHPFYFQPNTPEPN